MRSCPRTVEQLIGGSAQSSHVRLGGRLASPHVLSDGLIAFVVVAWLLCAVTAAGIAIRKGRSGLGFFLLGLLLGLIGVIIAAVINGEMPPPKGSRATSCPRCNARQNIERGQDEFECWQCGIEVPVEWV